MDDFEAIFGPNDMMDVKHPSGFVFGFTVKTDAQGHIDLDGPSIEGTGDTWPDEDLQQRACDFARKAAEEHWWDRHSILQYGWIALAIAALLVVLRETDGRFDTFHARCGLAVMTLAGLQVASPVL